MKKTFLTILASSLLTSSLLANECSDKLKYDFTFFGAPDKSYVVTKNTFKTATSTFPEGKLLNATLDIDALSIDTSADLNNINAKWPPAMANIRNMNTINNFFKQFKTDIGKVHVKIIKIAKKSMDVEFTMNGVSKSVPFEYIEEGGMIKAKGKLDVLAFNTQDAWKRFSAVCRSFHHGKSWSEIDINFEVPSSCK